MAIGIIGAMDEEVAYLKKQMTDKKTDTVAGVLFIQGVLNSKQVILVKSGIGKVNAAMTATILMEKFNPTAIINTGTAGGFSEQLEVADLVIGEESVHHDVDVTGFDYAYGQVPGMPERYQADKTLVDTAYKVLERLDIRHKAGLIATGDTFMNQTDKINLVQSRFPDLIAMEMEAAAIAQVSYQYNKPFIIVRALSDIAGKDAPMSFNHFVDIASKNAARFIMEMLDNM